MRFDIFKSKKCMIVFLHDSLMIFLAWVGAFWLRFNLGNIPEDAFKHAEGALPFVVSIQALVYCMFGLYRGIWRFASLPDLIRIIKAVAAGILIAALVLFLNQRLLDIPRSIFPLYGLLLVTFLGGSRFAYRWLKDGCETRGNHRVLIVGAGRAGEWITRDLKRDTSRKYQVIAFVDDKPEKNGHEIHGVRVLGQCKDIPHLVKIHQIDLILIAVPSASSADMRRIVSHCESSGVTFRTLPGLKDIADGHVKIDSIREVSLDDLLGRDPIALDWKIIQFDVENQVILVTGAGGSIGSELCRQIASLKPRQLIVLENNEFNLYQLKLELDRHFQGVEVIDYLVDVADEVAVAAVFQTHSVDMVFHAAAYKHVPMLEERLRAAVKNNILGTQRVAQQAVLANVKKFVLISTDKAVNPTNVMGATKRAAEIFCQNYNAVSQTCFITVRFGNVLGSAGSVVPLFRQQIAMGGPLTITHPEITRYFMTIPEAAQLILQATVMGQGGEIFVLDMGEPIKISYLAEQMILLAGLKPGEDIDIQYIGLRPGEKLFEELFHESESLKPTPHQKILRASYRHRDWKDLQKALKQIETGCQNNHLEMIWEALLWLVPEYQPSDLVLNQSTDISKYATKNLFKIKDVSELLYAENT